MNGDLTAQMLDVLDVIGNRGLTAHEAGVNGVTMKFMAQRGLLYGDDGVPPIYGLTAKGAAMAELMRSPVHFIPAEGKIARIQRITAHRFRIPLAEMWGQCRSRGVARPRQVAMYLSRELTPLSLPAIGQRFGKRDHTTVIHAINKIETLMAGDPDLALKVNEIRAEVGA